MPIEITMPALSPTMEEGNLAKWMVEEGDSVAPGDVIAEIETDKATMEVEAVDEGVIAKILVAEGSEGVKVNAVIALLAEDGENVAAVASAPVSAKSATSTEPPHLEPAESTKIPHPEPAESTKIPHPEPADSSNPPLPEPVEGRGAAGSEPSAMVRQAHHEGSVAHHEGSGDVAATPLAKRVAGQQGIDLASVTGTGARNKIMLADVENVKPAKADSGGNRLFASPLARKISADAGLDLTQIVGTGPNGRIVQKDVEAAMASGSAAAVSATAEAPVPVADAMPDDAVLRLYEEGSYELKKHDSMRRIIAARLTESSQTIPVYYLTIDCELDNMLALRAQMNAAAPLGEDDKPSYRISVNDFIVKAMAMALNRVPLANASWTSHSRILHKHADVGVAVAIPDGLITPIVRKAEQKPLSVISAEIKDMAGRARNKKLMPEEYQGGSTAVSNLGMFGVKEFTSIINPPHASIVSIGAGEKRPVVKDGELTVATVMSASFAFDHRVIDGALGAELAASFKQFIEQPAGMLA